MKLRDEGPELFEEKDTDLFQVTFGATGGFVAMIGGSEVFDIAIEANGLGCSRKFPFGGAKEDGYVTMIDLSDARRDGSGFEWMIDGGKNDGVAGHLNNDAATG